ncbi:hypothetical protein NO1_2088 [Candidatus Termititenax aidoneus]|uniref:Uncharacterized protein n=1 Tax=Termititenax aidoneus TaxID=2218524 RepID=A0A388TDJ8_TERA1|nr:hypothetical protein NO1_2088 [Candidatus Termititenax aidoneus]
MFDNSPQNFLRIKYNLLRSHPPTITSTPNIVAQARPLPGLNQQAAPFSNEAAREYYASAYDAVIDKFFLEALLADQEIWAGADNLNSVAESWVKSFQYDALQEAFPPQLKDLYNAPEYTALRKEKGEVYALTKLIYEQYFKGKDYKTAYLIQAGDPRPVIMFKAYFGEFLAKKLKSKYGKMTEAEKIDIFSVYTDYTSGTASLSADIWQAEAMTAEQKAVFGSVELSNQIVGVKEGILLLDFPEEKQSRLISWNELEPERLAQSMREKGLADFDNEFYQEFYAGWQAWRNAPRYDVPTPEYIFNDDNSINRPVYSGMDTDEIRYQTNGILFLPEEKPEHWWQRLLQLLRELPPLPLLISKPAYVGIN